MTSGFCEWRGNIKPLVLPFLLLLFPTLCVLFSSCGFLVGLSIGKWQGLLSLFITLAAGWVLTLGWRSKIQMVLFFLGIIFISVAFVGFFVLYSDPDVEWYHRPAVHLLVKGWNPVFDSTPEQIELLHEPKETSFSYRHVAYLPRGSWVLGAVFYRLFGYAEVGDSVNLVFAVALFLVLWKGFKELYCCSLWLRGCFVTLIVVSPEVVNCLTGGMNDGLFYMSFVLSAVSVLMLGKTGQVKWCPFFIFGTVWMCNVKFSGVVCTGASTLVILVWIGYRAVRSRDFSKLKVWAFSLGLAGCLSVIIGFSPYLTNWVHFGSPFYPQHTFNKSSKLDSITYDFDIKNDDAKRMGYVGRQVYAYISEYLASYYYKSTSQKKHFAPRFEVSASGFGSIFRLIFLISLVLWITRFRRSEAGPLLLILLICVLLQPTKYVGYGRYVSFFFTFPILVFMEWCAETKLGRIRQLHVGVGLGLTFILWGSLMSSCPTRLAFKWYVSDQNLALIEMARKDKTSFFMTKHYSIFHCLRDWGISPVSSANNTYVNTDWRCYQAGRAPFVLYSQAREVEHYLPFDMEAIGQQRGSFVRFFVCDFLPRGVKTLPSFIGRVTRWRLEQLCRVWRKYPENGRCGTQSNPCV